MQMIPDEATVQRMSAGPNQLSFVVVSNCMRTRSGAATIYIGNARVATDLTPLKCTPFAPPRVVLGDPIVATFELSKGNARVHSLDDIRVMDLVGETAGTLVSAR